MDRLLDKQIRKEKKNMQMNHKIQFITVQFLIPQRVRAHGPNTGTNGFKHRPYMPMGTIRNPKNMTFLPNAESHCIEVTKKRKERKMNSGCRFGAEETGLHYWGTVCGHPSPNALW